MRFDWEDNVIIGQNYAIVKDIADNQIVVTNNTLRYLDKKDIKVNETT